MSRTYAWILIVAWLVCITSKSAVAQDDSPFKNLDFSSWEGGEPSDWEVAIGATNGADTPLSVLEKSELDGMRLAGDVETRAWRFVSQKAELSRSAFLQISITMHAKELRREGNQYDNCYAAIILRNDAGTEIYRQMAYPTDVPENHFLYVRVPDGVGRWTAEIMFFLSKTGQFEINEVKVSSLTPEDSFDLLVAEMDRKYSHFESKDMDWDELTKTYSQRLNESPDEFHSVLSEFLGELQDLHIWIVRPDGRRLYPHRSSYDRNFHPRGLLTRDFELIADIPNLGSVGKTSDGFGVISLRSMQANDETIRQFDEAFAEIRDAPGIIMDLRRNSGGAEGVGQYIAGYFTDRRRAYAGSVIRNGPNHDDFSEMSLRYIGPKNGIAPYTRPVVCLIGPGCVSSGEGMTMMFKSLPNVTLAGQPTRGASGNPQPVPLPNGTDVWFSRWVALLPDGTPIEGIGIQPDVVIEHRDDDARFDVTFDRAVELLHKKIDDE